MSNGTAILEAATWRDARDAVAVGDGGTIVASTDDGASWQVQHCATTGDLESVACATPTRAWIVGTGDRAFATVDGGRH